MGDPDIGDHADVRAGDFRKPRHFPKVADAHLKHGHLVFFTDIEDGEREADLVIKIALGLEDVVFL